jgi:hypothetical protein
LGVGIGGYAVASFVASAAVSVRLLHPQHAQAQASAGMLAFGDLLLFVFVFGAVALFLTGLALYFLRPLGKFWTVFSGGSLALAGTGLGAALVIAQASTPPANSFGGALAGIGVLRMLPAPLLAIGFALSTFIAPNRRSRRTSLAATLIEGAVGAYAFVHWFLSPYLNTHFRV